MIEGTVKKVLIAGKDSYIGNSIKNYLSEWDEYSIEELSMINNQWKEKTLEGYDTVIFVAGIAHIKETEKNKDLYYQVNYKLAIEFARKCKVDGINHFIYLSSMSVFGKDSGCIDSSTPVTPLSHYGKLKRMAEENLMKLANSNFKVLCVRPPMVYGKGCKGNYAKLRNLILKTPIFITFTNKRSMIFEENLAIFLKSYIDKIETGFRHPQNSKYGSTYELCSLISEKNKKRTYILKLKKLPFIFKKTPIFIKLFGSLYYDYSIDNSPISLNLVEFVDSIHRSEKSK